MSSVEGQMAASALDALDSGLIVVDTSGVVTVWNAWMSAASGLPARAAIGRSLPDIFPDASLGRLAAAVADAIELGASSLITHTLHPRLLPLRTRTGRPMVCDVSLRPMGEKPYSHCTIQIADVTLATERERVLR